MPKKVKNHPPSSYIVVKKNICDYLSSKKTLIDAERGGGKKTFSFAKCEQNFSSVSSFPCR